VAVGMCPGKNSLAHGSSCDGDADLTAVVTTESGRASCFVVGHHMVWLGACGGAKVASGAAVAAEAAKATSEQATAASLQLSASTDKGITHAATPLTAAHMSWTPTGDGKMQCASVISVSEGMWRKPPRLPSVIVDRNSCSPSTAEKAFAAAPALQSRSNAAVPSVSIAPLMSILLQPAK